MADESRQRKVAENIRLTVAQLLEGGIKDPRLGFVTVTEVRMSGDLQHATVFYTVLGDEEDRKSTAAALRSARGLIRSEVGKNLGIRLTPQLEFVLDALPETAASMEDALRAAREHDEQVARLAAQAQYAAGEDPYLPSVQADQPFEADSAEDES